ncbi:MAG: SCO family protein, partial [Alphaproteobacteria bacterium]|nr:SCO family protein [Alphaproteobacteria bacterium]
LVGTPTMMFFGYTFCPDVCPTTLFEASAWRQSLGLDEKSLQIIFVTVDPARDTLEVVRDYLSPFDPPILGLAGNAAETEEIKSSFGIFSEIEGEENDPYYLVSHTSSILLFDREGQFKATISFGEATDSALAKLRALVAG